MVSQVDVARRAGVSFMTVSRVINNKGSVRESTRNRVQEAIEELDYYPNLMARALNVNRTETIGILIPRRTYLFASQYYTELLTGVEDHLAGTSYGILLYPNLFESPVIDYKRLFHERRVDGLIIIAPPAKDLQLLELVENKIPFVVLDGRKAGGSGKGLIYVDADNEGGAKKAVEYLYKNGHRKIATICGISHVINSMDRLSGFKKALKTLKLSERKEYIRKGEFTEASGYQAMTDLLNLHDPPTAVFAANDLMAIGALRAARDRDMNIPDDISIIGFDDIPIASYTEPTLTTIHQPAFDLGAEGAKLLLSLISHPEMELHSKILNTELVVRRSTKNI